MRKVLQEMDRRLVSLVGEQTIMEGRDYKRSRYVHESVRTEGHVLFHTLSQQCVELTDDSIRAWTDVNERISASRILENETLTYLAQNGYLVPEDRDETEYYLTLIRLLRMSKAKKGFRKYVILPTTACNARCPYCFEQGIKFRSMTDEMVESVIAFIQRTHADEELFLVWFGGEPLMGVSAIERICAALNAGQIPFKSTITTNGSLITEEIADRMVREWHLKSAQITIDGPEEVYNRTKAYVTDLGESPYRRILKNIHTLAQREIRVKIRLNVSLENYEEIRGLLPELQEEFAAEPLVRIYAMGLYGERGVEGDDRIRILVKGINEELRNLRSDPSSEATEDVDDPRGELRRSAPALRLKVCAADDPRHIVIAPDGLGYRCQHLNETQPIAALSDIRSTLSLEPDKPAERCRDCTFLPQCGSFTGCPIRKWNNCKELKIDSVEKYIEKLAKTE